MPLQRLLPLGLLMALALLASGAARADARAEVYASHQAMVDAGRFRSIGTSESKQGTRHIESTVVWPDRFHVRNEDQEFILLPGATYTKVGEKWQRMPLDLSAMIKSMSPDAVRQGYDNMTNLKDLGSETVEGKTAHVYEYDTHASLMGIEAKSHVKTWIDAATHLPIKQEVQGEAMGVSSRTEQRYEFDPTIKVEAPL